MLLHETDLVHDVNFFSEKNFLEHRHRHLYRCRRRHHHQLTVEGGLQLLATNFLVVSEAYVCCSVCSPEPTTKQKYHKNQVMEVPI